MSDALPYANRISQVVTSDGWLFEPVGPWVWVWAPAEPVAGFEWVCDPLDPVLPWVWEWLPDDDIEVSMVWECDPPDPVLPWEWEWEPEDEMEWVCATAALVARPPDARSTIPVPPAPVAPPWE